MIRGRSSGELEWSRLNAPDAHVDSPWSLDEDQMVDLIDAASSRATWQNLDGLSSIKRTGLKEDDSQIDVQSESLIKDETPHPTVVPKFLYKIKMFFNGELILGFLGKSNCFDTTIL